MRRTPFSFLPFQSHFKAPPCAIPPDPLIFTAFTNWHSLCLSPCVSVNVTYLLAGGDPMKLVTVVIKPFKLEDVREALSSIGIQGLTVSEVKGFGRQKGHAELYRGAEYSVNFLPKVKIDIAIADDQLDEVVDVISKAAYTGKIGDGKIFVAELQRVIRIRTGETDEAAL
ncbi:nitrogen regulatory protein PII [Pantoea anthophila]|nr:nitrogen regulatory protein PII [Pantoea anthophila]